MNIADEVARGSLNPSRIFLGEVAARWAAGSAEPMLCSVVIRHPATEVTP